MDYISGIVGFCLERGIELQVIVTPSHVHQLELDAVTGAWPALEEGKRKLVRIIQEANGRHGSGTPVKLYDFSGYSAVTTEALPPEGSRSEMGYYWDSSHFKEVVGDKVLDVILSDSPAPDGFGRELSPDTVERFIEDLRDGRAAYERSHPQDMARLWGWVEASKSDSVWENPA